MPLANRLYGLAFITLLATLIPGVALMPYLDECMVVVIGLIMLADCIINGNPRRYRLGWIVTGVMAFYAAYSIVIGSNILTAVAIDAIVQLKPLLPFAVIVASGLRLTPAYKRACRFIAVVNCIAALWLSLLPEKDMAAFIHHDMYISSTIFISSMVYWLCSIDSKGDYSLSTLTVLLMMLASGTICGRTKYYASALVAAAIAIACCGRLTNFFMRNRRMFFTIIAILVAIVAWEKFEFYFLSGTRTRANPGDMTEMARQALYITSLLIFAEYFPFGSGLASFASGASANYYSDIYFEYGLNHVWGMSPGFSAFVCDAFYPSLAQFGVVGVGVFVAFWISVIKRIRRCPLRGFNGLSWAIIANLAIDAVAQTSLVQQSGMCSMMMLAMVCVMSVGKTVPDTPSPTHKLQFRPLIP